jgi:hypothetical protein
VSSLRLEIGAQRRHYNNQNVHCDDWHTCYWSAGDSSKDAFLSMLRDIAILTGSMMPMAENGIKIANDIMRKRSS